MTSIQVRFFASLREAVGRGDLHVATNGGPIDLDALIARLASELDAEVVSRLRAPGVRVAVNRTLVEGNVPLKDRDEVAFLPPVTGG
jgi:sulfur-carrier protein